ncbi:MAG TPA: aspartate kinase [Clostridia bacterium]|nr:aspartate kinase [Clostridia bacterium]
MGVVVQKYGGSSVASPEKIKNVAKRVVQEKEKGNSVIVVVSAMGDTTDELLALAKQISKNPPAREMDMLLSTGEQISISLLAMAIKEFDYPVISLTGQQVGILTDSSHTKAKILKINIDRLKKELENDQIVIVAGFQGVNEFNDITTLGRGGSDTTAVAIAAAINADRCEIYTDVDGVYTADPRIVIDAKKLKEVTYDEMLEMASLGAQVLQPRAVECAKQYGVIIHVRSSFSYEEGTAVKEACEMEKERLVSGVTCDLNTAKIAILEVPDRPGIAYKIFSALAKANINVDMIIQSIMRDNVNDISFTISESDADLALEITKGVADEIGAKGVKFSKDVAKVSIVGAGMVNNPGVAATMFETLAEEGINIQMITTSEIKISCLIDASSAIKAVKALHKKFNLS